MRPSHSRAAALLLGTFVACGLVAATLAARHTHDAASSPLHPSGGWRAVWIVSVSGAFVAYVAGAALLRRTRGHLGLVLAIAAVVQLAPLAGPLLLSTDAYTYWEYGRLADAHHANPYRTAPNRFPDDPAYLRMGSSWRSDTTIYGPGFTALSRADAAVAGTSSRTAVRFYRVLGALSILAAAILAAAIASPRRALAAAFVGWNPLLALHFAGGGHNDALMMALVLGALLLVERRRPGLAAPAWMAAISVKWIAVAFLPLVLLRERNAGRRLGLAALATSAAVFAALATLLYGLSWTDAAGRLSSQARKTGSLGLAKWLGDVGLAHRPTVLLLGLAQLALYAWLLRSAARGRVRLGIAGTGIAALQGWLNPWYACWGVTLSAAEDDGAAQLLSILLCALVLRDALPV